MVGCSEFVDGFFTNSFSTIGWSIVINRIGFSSVEQICHWMDSYDLKIAYRSSYSSKQGPQLNGAGDSNSIFLLESSDSELCET